MDESDYININSVIFTNQGIHVSPEGSLSVVLNIRKVTYNGTEVWSSTIEVDQPGLRELIRGLEQWIQQFNAIKFVELTKKEE